MMTQRAKNKFGKLLKRLREECNTTPQALADKAGLSLVRFTQIEQGKGREPSWLTVVALARALGIDLCEFDPD